MSRLYFSGSNRNSPGGVFNVRIRRSGSVKLRSEQIYNKKHHQSLAGHPGASGYAPGQQFRMHNKRTAQGLPGASGYAPGHKKY
jgi:hypothetical protein